MARGTPEHAPGHQKFSNGKRSKCCGETAKSGNFSRGELACWGGAGCDMPTGLVSEIAHGGGSNAERRTPNPAADMGWLSMTDGRVGQGKVE